jgi:hypothetical protein
MFQKQPANAELQDAIDRLLAKLKDLDPSTKEYETVVSRLSELNAIKAANAKTALSKDTLATIGANLFGIWLILHYERVNLVGSKALSFVQKLR